MIKVKKKYMVQSRHTVTYACFFVMALKYNCKLPKILTIKVPLNLASRIFPSQLNINLCVVDYTEGSSRQTLKIISCLSVL